MKLADKVVVVTGGGSGLGQELVRQLVARGASVAALDISEPGLAETSAGLDPKRVTSFVGSVADRAFVEQLPARVIERYGRVDGLINNAGLIHPFVRFHELEWSAIDRVLDVNLKGTMNTMHAFLPHLLARPEGHVLNVGSIGGVVTVPGQTVYSASKAALKLLTEGVHFELMHSNVRVSLALPGQMDTKIIDNSKIPIPAAALTSEMRRFKGVTAAKAAAQVLDGMEADAYHIIVGADARFMNAFNRLSPRRAATLVAKQLGALLGN